MAVTDSEGLQSTDTCIVNISYSPSTATDLNGSWNYVKYRFSNRYSWLTCSFQVINSGEKNNLPFSVAFYLSDDNLFDNNDRLLKTIEVDAVSMKSPKLIYMRTRIKDLKIGDHIIAVVDASDEVFETDETNNIEYSAVQ